MLSFLSPTPKKRNRDTLSINCYEQKCIQESSLKKSFLEGSKALRELSYKELSTRKLHMQEMNRKSHRSGEKFAIKESKIN